jgi:hypothetical protein
MIPSIPSRVSAAVVRAGNAVGDELFPILVWLTVFGVTRLAPSLILRLSIAVPQSMDFPRLLQCRRRPSAESHLTADELSARLADLINAAPFGPLSGGGAGGAAALLPDQSAWVRTWRHLSEGLFAICTYPRRLLTYVLFQHSQRPALQSSDAAQRCRPVVVRMLLRLVTSFTATWVHASGHMLYDTVITYLSTRIGSWGGGGATGFVLGNGGPGQNPSSTRLSSGWRDLLVAAGVSTSVNFLLQTFWLEAMTSVGELRSLGRRAASSNSPNAARDDPANSFTHVVLSTLSRLGSKDTLYRLGRMALQPQATLTSAFASPPAQPSSTVIPTAAAPAATPAPLARVYLCGGNAFVFALSGFRFSFYSDFQQLTTSAANVVTDALDLLLRQANQRAAAQRYRSVDAAGVSAGGAGQAWRPPASLQAAGLATSNDVVLSPASSMQLLPVYIVNFVVGAGAGLVWRERRVLIAACRQIPLVRSVLAVVLPLPPSPLKLPDALQELSPECNVLLIYFSGAVEVAAEDHAALIVKQDGTEERQHQQQRQQQQLHTAVRARIVVAQDLFCPIKRTLMSDPVQTADGFTYDRDGIEEWLRVHDTAPLTNLHLDNVAVCVNSTARRQIEELIAQFTAAMQTA